MRTSFALAIGAVALLASAPLAAQTSCTGSGCSVNHNVHATVNDVLSLSLDNAATDLGTPTAAQYGAGNGVATNGPTATVVANRPYTVTLVGPANFTYSGSYGPVSKPSSDLTWGTVAGTYGNDMSTSATVMSGTPTAGDTQQIFFNTLWDITRDTPGDYSMDVTFTLTAP